MKNNRKDKCLERSYKLIARKYRSMGKIKKATGFVQKAQKSGWVFFAKDGIIKEINMSIPRYTIQRLVRLL